MRQLVVTCGLVIAIAALAIADDSASPSINQGEPSVFKGSIKFGEHWEDNAREGVSWQGVAVYLVDMRGPFGPVTPTDRVLAAVDEKSGETLWWNDVGAFWARVGFKEIDGRWAVELRPPQDEGEPRDLSQYYDLRTGEVIRPDKPAVGTLIVPRYLNLGVRQSFGEGSLTLVASTEAWSELCERMFGQSPKELRVHQFTRRGFEATSSDVDFANEVILVACYGRTERIGFVFCSGIFECEDRVLVRLGESWQRTASGCPEVSYRRLNPTIAIVLPRREKPYIVQYTAPGCFGAPSTWKVAARLELPAKDADAPEGLPDK